MFRITIDQDRCTGCGLCVGDCLVNDIELADGKALAHNQNCFQCGHCLAICPQKAVEPDKGREDIKEYEEGPFTLEPETLLNVIKFRRSGRRYQAKEVERGQAWKNHPKPAGLQKRPSNSQGVSYILSRKKFPSSGKIAAKKLKSLVKSAIISAVWILIKATFSSGMRRRIILTLAKSEVDAALAASRMELMAVARGLGVFSAACL